MKFTFQKHLSAPPEAVWYYITEPKFINLWSTASIETLDIGDGGEAGTVGAIRQVSIPTPGGSIQIQNEGNVLQI